MKTGRSGKQWLSPMCLRFPSVDLWGKWDELICKVDGISTIVPHKSEGQQVELEELKRGSSRHCGGVPGGLFSAFRVCQATWVMRNWCALLSVYSSSIEMFKHSFSFLKWYIRDGKIASKGVKGSLYKKTKKYSEGKEWISESKAKS